MGSVEREARITELERRIDELERRLDGQCGVLSDAVRRVKQLGAALVVAVLTACTSPVEPPCVELLVPLTGVLRADSLEAEGWTVLPGDTIAVREIEPEACP